jgi:hypothetical protein
MLHQHNVQDTTLNQWSNAAVRTWKNTVSTRSHRKMTQNSEAPAIWSWACSADTTSEPHSTKTAAFAPQTIVHFRTYTHAEGSGAPAATWSQSSIYKGCTHAQRPFCSLRWCPMRHPVARAKLCAGWCGMAVYTVLLGVPATAAPLRAGARAWRGCQPRPRKLAESFRRGRWGQRRAA